MSSIEKKETGCGLGDDRNYFEDEILSSGTALLWRGLDATREAEKDPVSRAEFFTASLAQPWTDLPAGVEPTFILPQAGDLIEWAEEAAVHINSISQGFDFYSLIDRGELDEKNTKATISDLQRNGVVTIVDGKTGLQIDADAYQTAALSLLGGAALPYEDTSEASPAKDWAHAAVRGVIDELLDRGGIGHALQDVDQVIRKEIVESLSDIVRAAFIRRAA
jgi:hypothetical protein